MCWAWCCPGYTCRTNSKPSRLSIGRSPRPFPAQMVPPLQQFVPVNVGPQTGSTLTGEGHVRSVPTVQSGIHSPRVMSPVVTPASTPHSMSSGLDTRQSAPQMDGQSRHTMMEGSGTPSALTQSDRTRPSTMASPALSQHSTAGIGSNDDKVHQSTPVMQSLKVSGSVPVSLIHLPSTQRSGTRSTSTRHSTSLAGGSGRNSERGESGARSAPGSPVRSEGSFRRSESERSSILTAMSVD